MNTKIDALNVFLTYGAMRCAHWRPTLLIVCAITTGCAGFRGGWESVAYTGEVPSVVRVERQRSDSVPELNLPGVKLHVTLDNRLRTYDTQVFLGLPLSVDPRNVYPKNHHPGKTRVFVSVTPEAGGFIFRPLLASLLIGGKEYQAARGLRFGMWDEQGRKVDRGGKWEHRDVGTELALVNPGTRYLLSLDFDVSVPSPESDDIALDLSTALKDMANAGSPPLPLIRFMPIRWKEGYT